MATKKFNFGESMKKIEELLAGLEQSESLDLEKSVKDVEEGLALLQSCRVYLETVKNSVEKVKAKFSSASPEIEE